jgi:hypothetical protein
MQKKKNIYAKIISIHYTYTYRFIHIHRQTYCIIGRIVYSFENHSGLLLTVPFDYMIALLRSVKQFQCLVATWFSKEYTNRPIIQYVCVCMCMNLYVYV